MPSYSTRVRVGTTVPKNATTSRGVPMQVVYRQTWTAPATADVDGHLTAQSMTAAGTATTFDGALAGVNDVSRCLVYDASGASTGTVTTVGKDQNGNARTEAVTLNGTAAVQGKVAFKSLTSITWTATSAVDLTVGTNDVLGLDYKMEVDSVFWELEDQVAATAGTVVAASASANADPLGTYDPNSALNAALDFDIFYVVTDIDNLT